MNYYELTFTYTSPVETSIINDVLAAELGEIGFESFAENENGLQGYISDQLYNVKGLQDKLAEFPLENVDIHFTETLVESKDWNEEWEKNYFKPIRIGKDALHDLLMTWLPRLTPAGAAYLVVQKNLGADSLIPWLATALGDDYEVSKYHSAKGYRVIEVLRNK